MFCQCWLPRTYVIPTGLWIPETGKIDRFLNTVTISSPGSIILLHDTYDETAAAVSPIIDKIRAKGLKLVTVAECMNDKDGAYVA